MRAGGRQTDMGIYINWYLIFMLIFPRMASEKILNIKVIKHKSQEVMDFLRKKHKLSRVS